ncbi:3-oxo-tetronate 4-phosphate decarboxylase [Deinococcus peraridilitoris]|uniref:3-oxo-tetronate 4-phosphate decarboxylase n=1 Tax=Deinococcus peraridilitoris (strain DSM 19664 / LMG 22246 / CIP 109416 / KR-200) TaxID=937777 RepID=K9ZWW9_DEIPD|nr:3-oxo-tetronate 4-phosphate decarboxylase [Deinococcus peraridilitoris]AFZ65674.1 ribulose-5-phosphate 4-epimerase-like epimerase or aldolase [Deinococcus peraridilitoris DSM 19664]
MIPTRERHQLVRLGRRLYERGLSPGTSGNLSVRLEGNAGWLLTPTNSCLGELTADNISHLDWDGTLLGGSPPSKESFLHLAYYRFRPETHAVVHLHSTFAVALSCLAHLNPHSCLPPLTPYFVMRIGNLPLVPYHRPGDQRLGDEVARLAPTHSAVLLANHGPVVSAPSLEDAVSAAEELEETARIFLALQGHPIRTLDAHQIEELQRTFGARWNPEA